jgi:hypothetical protein
MTKLYDVNTSPYSLTNISVGFKELSKNYIIASLLSKLFTS